MKTFKKQIPIEELNTGSIPHKGEMLLFDIETTGLRKETSQMYLIGCGYFEDRELVIKQWLTEKALDEPEILEAFSDFACSRRILVHFNGDGFDIPYTEYKAEYYGMDSPFAGMESMDIYKLIKPAKKLLGLEHMNQKSIERFLGIERNDIYNGGQLIGVYHEYEMTASLAAEGKLLLHNFEDVLGMAQMFSMLSYSRLFSADYRFESYQEISKTAVMEYRLPESVPQPAVYECDRFQLFAEDDLLQINISITDGHIHIPLSDPENYYYLQDEDTVIHKDVAGFVDKGHRKKATKKNCWMKVEAELLETMPPSQFCSIAANIISLISK